MTSRVAMPFLTILTVLSFDLAAYAGGATGSDSILKVRSYPCGQGDRDLQHALTGSGTLVMGPKGEVVVLTSSHVVYHASSAKGFCTEVLGTDKTWRSSELWHVNAGLGVAILRLSPEQAPASALSLDTTASSAGTSVGIYGYPHADEAAIGDTGRILTGESRRVLLPLLSHVIEVKAAHNEYGMSGGALLDETSTRYLGLLSHQYLAIAAGQRALMEERRAVSQAGGAELIALVIPSVTIARWFATIEADSPQELREDTEAQRRGLSALTFGSLRLTEQSCDGDGEVGGQGVGIGGQGVGIGGSDQAAKICGIALQRVTGDQINRQAWPWPDTAAWLVDMDRHLPVDHAAIIRQLVDRKTLVKQGVRNLYQFMTLFRDGYRPLVEGLDDQEQILGPQLTAQIAIVQKTSQELLPSCQGNTAPATCAQLMDYAAFVTQAATSGNWYLIDTVYMRRVLQIGQAETLFKPAWVYVFNQDFDRALALSQAMIRMTDLLDAMTGALKPGDQ